eukprot:TRINITY_DN24130_c0_g1_i1.p1 TRINITY_DN24130_c0_g1~~TRINITY_DN24130_c0_g1_i1.p1  ORF type:complete len:428 (+),score=114.93 TRINITY_DN24130_c0_g1_i1:122-1405(+)
MTSRWKGSRASKGERREKASDTPRPLESKDPEISGKGKSWKARGIDWTAASGRENAPANKGKAAVKTAWSDDRGKEACEEREGKSGKNGKNGKNCKGKGHGDSDEVRPDGCNSGKGKATEAAKGKQGRDGKGKGKVNGKWSGGAGASLGDDSGKAVQLRKDDLVVESGEILSLQRTGLLSDSDLWDIFEQASRLSQFRNFAGRAILDVKVDGASTLALTPNFAVLQPLVDALVAIARGSLRGGEELALLQLIVNFYKDGGSAVRRHQHRCRQVCASLGAARRVIVEDAAMTMVHGDALPLNREFHAVPEAEGVSEARLSVCLFYGSAEEYRQQSISVNANDGNFGDSYWWNHPRDLDSQSKPGKAKGAPKGGHNAAGPSGRKAGGGRSAAAGASTAGAAADKAGAAAARGAGERSGGRTWRARRPAD